MRLRAMVLAALGTLSASGAAWADLVLAPGKAGNPACIRPDEPGPAKYALLALAHYHRALDPSGLAHVKRGLAWMADVLAATQGAGVIGESWTVRDGRVLSYVSRPHVWEQTLFYLAAIEAHGRSPYRSGRPDRSAAAPAVRS